MSAIFLIGSIALALPAPAAETVESGTGAQAPAERAKGALTEQEREEVRRTLREQDLERFSEVGETVRPDETAVAERQVVIGQPFPAALPVRPVPERVLGKLPKKAGHEYRLFGDNLALVDTQTNEVTDIVREIYSREDKNKARKKDEG